MNGTPPRALRARADEDLALAQRNRRGGNPFPAETETRPEAHRWGQGVWGQQCSLRHLYRPKKRDYNPVVC